MNVYRVSQNGTKFFLVIADNETLAVKEWSHLSWTRKADATGCIVEFIRSRY